MTEEKQQMPGAFFASLKRNNKQIRDDRAEAISEETELLYKRAVENLEIDIKRMQRKQESKLDLSVTNTHSLEVAKDFDAIDYVDGDTKLGLDIRNAEIKLDIAKRRYEHLFGGGA